MKHAKLSVSIIVPMYRSKDTIQRALASIMMNQAIDGEIIVIDDASNDDGLLVAYDYLQNKNLDMLTLGTLILRAETAATVALGNIIYEYSNYNR